MNPSVLAKIETVAQKAIDGKMAPGMQILVARKGKVIYQKSFGYQTYERRQTSLIQIYMMSLTKILSTLPNVMLQYDQQNIKMETTLGSMLPIFKIQINKTYTLRNCCRIMQPWIPFATVDKNGNPLDKYYKVESGRFSTKVADSLYLRNDYHDTIMKLIADSKLLPQKNTDTVTSHLSF
jgi:hypothetical protein